MERVFRTNLEQAQEVGRQRGRREGHREGLSEAADALRRSLHKTLGARFPGETERLAAALAQASWEQLLDWNERRERLALAELVGEAR